MNSFRLGNCNLRICWKGDIFMLYQFLMRIYAHCTLYIAHNPIFATRKRIPMRISSLYPWQAWETNHKTQWNYLCSESVNLKHQSSISRKSSSVPRASNVNVGTFDAQAFYLRPFKIQKLQGERTGKKAEQSISKKTLRHCSHNSPSPRLPDEIWLG